MAEQEVKAIFSADTSGVTSGAKQASSAVKGYTDSIRKGMGNADKPTKTLGGSIKNIAVGVGAVAAVTAAIGVLKGSIGSAVGRFDTLNAYPKVMKQMGFSTKDTDSSIKILKKGIDGLPTSLQEITKSSQSFAILTKSATTGAKTATALNDAFLASGASAGDASRGVQQYSQMLASGKVDLMSWRTLQETMPYALTKVAKSFGLTGKSAEKDLYAKLQSGEITVDQLNQKFMELDGGVNGFANTARSATGGIGTSFTNMKNAVTNGLANMIKAIDNGLKSAGLGGIAEIFNKAKDVIVNSFVVINGAVEKAIPKIIDAFKKIYEAVKQVIDFVQKNSDWIMPLVVGIGAGIGAFTAITKAINIAKGAMVIFNGIMALNPFVLIISAIVGVVAALVWFFTQTETGKKAWKSFSDFMVGLWDGIVDGVKVAGKAISDAWNATVEFVKSVWSGIVDFFTNLWASITSAFTNAWTTIITGIQTAWTGVVDFFTGIWNTIIETLQPLFTAFTTGWTNLVATLTGIWNGIVTVATGIWNLLYAAIMGVVLLIIDFVTGNFTQLGEDAKMIWDSIVSALSQIWNGIVQIATTLFNALMQGINNIWNSIASFASSVWNSIVSTVVGIWNGFVSAATSFANGLFNGIKGVWNGITGWASGLWNGVKSTISGVWNGIVSTITNLANSAINGLKGAWNGITGWVSGLWNGVKSTIQGAMNFDLGAAGRAIMDSFLGGLQAAWGAVKSFVGGIASWVRDHKGPISYDKRLLIPAGKAIMGGFNSSLQSSFENVKKTVNGVAPYIASAISGQGDYMINTRLSDNMQLDNGSLSVDMNNNVQPAIINLNMGGSDWRAHVDDISNTQGNSARLSRNNSVYL